MPSAQKAVLLVLALVQETLRACDGLRPVLLSIRGPTLCVGLSRPCWPRTVQGPDVDLPLVGSS